MYTQDSNYKEMAAKVKELGLTVESTKKVDLIEALNSHEAEVSENETRGRKINPNSARQIRLAAMEAKRGAGTLRRGRPEGSGKVEEVVESLIEKPVPTSTTAE